MGNCGLKKKVTGLLNTYTYIRIYVYIKNIILIESNMIFLIHYTYEMNLKITQCKELLALTVQLASVCRSGCYYLYIII